MLAAAPEPCSRCSRASPAGWVVCPNCGFNRATGEVTRTKFQAAPKEERTVADSGAGDGLSSALSKFADSPLATLVVLVLVAGICVGGAMLGATAFSGNVGFGFVISIAMGVLSGVALLGILRHNANDGMAALAAGMVLIGSIAGQYTAEETAVGDWLDEAIQRENLRVTEESVIGLIALDIAEDMERRGAQLDWPEWPAPGINEEDVGPYVLYWQWEYPPSLWKAATDQYAKLDQAGRDAAWARAQNDFQRLLAEIREESAGQAVRDSVGSSGSEGRRRLGLGRVGRSKVRAIRELLEAIGPVFGAALIGAGAAYGLGCGRFVSIDKA